jgi:hypothetical protein
MKNQFISITPKNKLGNISQRRIIQFKLEVNEKLLRVTHSDLNLDKGGDSLPGGVKNRTSWQKLFQRYRSEQEMDMVQDA